MYLSKIFIVAYWIHPTFQGICHRLISFTLTCHSRKRHDIETAILNLMSIFDKLLLQNNIWGRCDISISVETDLQVLHLKLYTRCVHVWVLTLNNDIYHNGFANMIKGNPSVQLWNKLCILLCAVSQYWIIVQSNNDRNVKCSH